MRSKITWLIAMSLVAVVAAACNGSFTTAKISKLEFGRSETGQPSAASFALTEKIYAIATVSGASGKYKMNFRVMYDEVAEKAKGQVALDQSIDFEGSRPIWLSFTAPSTGQYIVEATLLSDDDKKIDTKAGTVTVTESDATFPAGPDKHEGSE